MDRSIGMTPGGDDGSGGGRSRSVAWRFRTAAARFLRAGQPLNACRCAALADGRPRNAKAAR